VIATIGFGVVAAIALLSALLVVRSANLVHAVLWLGITLTDTAVLYGMLGASFLAGVQVLLYVGGVVTLMIFGVMLTRRHDGISVPAERGSPWRGLLTAASVFGLLAAAVLRSDLAPAAITVTPVAAAPGSQATTQAIGLALLSTHVLAFEVLSLLLLAAIIGAIVIARRRDHGAPATGARTEASS
jgi:NADH-quinone oxidoreductase subunit J